MAFAIGVDLGGTNLRIAAVDERGQVLDKITTGTEVARGRDSVINEMCEAILQLARKHASETIAPFRGIGVGVPGIIDMDSGMLRESPNLPGWHDYPVRDEIERRLGTTVILENDANVAALGEFWLGAAGKVESACMLTLGTGVGGGVVLDGKIWNGMNGMAGELGHVNVFPDGHPCGCGSRGCIEQYASATAIKRMALEAIGEGKAPGLASQMRGASDVTSKVIYQFAVNGDSGAQEIFNRVGDALGIILAGLINGLNLPMYIVGGGVSAAWDAFAPAMFEAVRRRSFVYRATGPDPDFPRKKVTQIVRATLGGDAGLIGAARLPLIGK